MWEILGIEPTREEQEIRAAYARQLSQHHPEEDPAGYQRLRQAYDRAMRYAQGEAEREEVPFGEAIIDYAEILEAQKALEQKLGKTLEDLEQLYQDPALRSDLVAWQEFFNAHDLIWDFRYLNLLDRPFFDFFSGHYLEVPAKVWELLEEHYRWGEDIVQNFSDYADLDARFLQVYLTAIGQDYAALVRKHRAKVEPSRWDPKFVGVTVTVGVALIAIIVPMLFRAGRTPSLPSIPAVNLDLRLDAYDLSAYRVNPVMGKRTLSGKENPYQEAPQTLPTLSMEATLLGGRQEVGFASIAQAQQEVCQALNTGEFGALQNGIVLDNLLQYGYLNTPAGNTPSALVEGYVRQTFLKNSTTAPFRAGSAPEGSGPSSWFYLEDAQGNALRFTLVRQGESWFLAPYQQKALGPAAAPILWQPIDTSALANQLYTEDDVALPLYALPSEEGYQNHFLMNHLNGATGITVVTGGQTVSQNVFFWSGEAQAVGMFSFVTEEPVTEIKEISVIQQDGEVRYYRLGALE